MTSGLLDLPWWGLIIATVVMAHITVMAVTLYLHRDQTHRGIDLHPVISHFYRFWLWLTSGMVTKEWVAVHRKHHARCETEDDPHSPQMVGLSKVLFQGAELYQDEAAKQETLDKYGRGTPDDWLEREIYTGRSYYGVFIMLFTDVILFGPIGLTIYAIQMITIPVLAAGIVNGVGHYWGYRSFECKDAATNVVPWGIVLGGEELHNNHHAFPSSAKFSLRSFEFDVGWLYIKIFLALGLVKIRRVAPAPVMETERPYIDLDAVKAIVINRLHVLRAYSSGVMLPVMRKELNAAGGRVRRLLTRDLCLLDDKAQENLGEILNQSNALRTVYEFRQGLQRLWEGHTVSNDRLVQQFKDWCSRAEETGIEALQRFAAELRRYRLQSRLN
ncbi:MAG: fatty acid desaturase [Gammaproteobacteria bacterium]